MFPVYISLQIKSIGLTYGLTDSFITNSLSIALIFNCISRMFTGFILEKISIKYYFVVILIALIVCSSTYILILRKEFLFILYLCCSYYVFGSLYVVMPIYYARVFGSEIGSESYSYFYTSNATS